MPTFAELGLTLNTPSNNQQSAQRVGTFNVNQAGSNNNPALTLQSGSQKVLNDFLNSKKTITNTNWQPVASGGGGGGGSYVPPQQIQSGGGEAPVDPYAQVKSEIGRAWDEYIGSLGGLTSGLQDQRTAQENIANTQYTSGQEQINKQKASSLRDIGNNISNALKAGNIYLGSRGAGDSSAANQYQFALSKEAAKQTGQLNEFVDGQMNTLKANYDTQVNQIASWFADAQNQVKQMIAQGQLSKAQDINNISRSILDQAMQARQQLQQNAQNRYNALVEWAAGNSSNIGQLTRNIAAIPQAIGAPQMDSSGNIVATPTGYGSNTDRQNLPLFQNPSWF